MEKDRYEPPEIERHNPEVEFRLRYRHKGVAYSLGRIATRENTYLYLFQDDWFDYAVHKFEIDGEEIATPLFDHEFIEALYNENWPFSWSPEPDEQDMRIWWAYQMERLDRDLDEL